MPSISDNVLIEKLSRLFSLNPSPALGVLDGKIVFSSTSAQAFFTQSLTGCAADSILPDHILSHDAESFVSSAYILDHHATVSASYFDRILVLVLNIAYQDLSLKSIAPPSLLGSLRSSAFTLKLAADQLTGKLDDVAQSNLESYTSMLYRSYYKMLRLTMNLDTANKLLDESITFEPRIWDLSTLCRDLVDSVSHVLNKEGLAINFHSSGEKIFANIDADKIEQLILNLLSNSIIHCREGCTIDVRVKRKGDKAIIFVDDDGCGISPQTLSSVFNRFEQQLEMSDIASGPGLGLSIAKGIAHLHNGALVIESRKDKGTSVRVMLPVSLTATSGLRDNDIPEKVMENILRELSDILGNEIYTRKYMED